jgi:hypothetical protein
MNKYTIDFTAKTEGSYSLIPIVEKVETNDGIGDIICIDSVDNILGVSCDFDVDDKNNREFLKDNFKNYKAVSGFIRRLNQ